MKVARKLIIYWCLWAPLFRHAGNLHVLLERNSNRVIPITSFIRIFCDFIVTRDLTGVIVSIHVFFFTWVKSSEEFREIRLYLPPADSKALVVELECGQKELGACESSLYCLPFEVVASWRRRSVRGRCAQVCILPPRLHGLACVSIWRHQPFPSSPVLSLADTTVP